MAERVVAVLDQVWSSIEDLCTSLTAADWKKDTDLPGWSVQDLLAHLCGIEALLLGRPAPPPIAEPWPPHVKNQLGAMNEAQIIERRVWAPEDVVTEFLELTAERLKVLAEMTPEQMDGEVAGPLGMAPAREFLAIRVMDSFFHEQDIRRATGNPGAMDGDGAAFAVARMRGALPKIVGKGAGAPDGSVVAFVVDGPAGFTGSVRIKDGRGAPTDGEAAGATATLRMDAEAFLLLTGGRRSCADVTVAIDGDADLARRVLDAMNVLF